MATTAPRVFLPGRLRTVGKIGSKGGSRGPLFQALARTFRNPMGLFGASVVLLLAVAAITAPWIAPYNPIEQHPGSELMPPGSLFPLGTDNLGRDLLSRIIFGSRN